MKEQTPKKSFKFGALSLYYNGVYYFPQDIETNDKHDRPYKIQGVYYDGKWRQDTMYITKDFKDFLMNFAA